MININVKENKGITLVTLMLAIMMMLIISSTLIYNASTAIRTRDLNNMYSDIKILKDKVDIYYAKFGTLPIIKDQYTNVDNLKNINANDNDKYYVIDLEAIENLTLTYGKEYKTYKESHSAPKKNIYVINEQSHTIYYVAGIKLDGKTYYTIPGEYTKVEVQAVNILKLKQITNNIAILEINATNKNVGIQTINLYKENTIYKTYEYTEETKEIKQEIIDITLPFYEESNWYIETIDTKGETLTSEIITLKNENIISTKEDMYKLAEIVNAGNTLEGKEIKQINDIDLEGSPSNPWRPIGNYEKNTNYQFAGIYDGSGNGIYNIYIDTTSSYQGLFGCNTGTIKNVGINTGTIKAGDASGSIVGYNKGTIESCYNLVNLYCNQGTHFGGIVGIQTDSKAKISKCYNKGNISGKITNQYGSMCGIAGYITNSVIEYSYNTGNILNVTSEENVKTCGITDATNGKIYSCYNTGNITTQMETNATYPVSAGIVGQIHGGEIYNCYNIGKTQIVTPLTTQIRNGAITGYYDSNTTIKNTYWLETSSQSGIAEMSLSASQDYEVIAIETEEEMKNIADSLDSEYKQDKNNINNGYPILNWQ